MIYILISSGLINLILIIYIIINYTNKKPVEKNGKELADFMQDIKKYGYGVVRIDPDSILYITPKKRG